jgi:hypothetical protein
MSGQLKGASITVQAGNFTNQKPRLEAVVESTAVTPPTALTRESPAERVELTNGVQIEAKPGVAAGMVIEPVISTYEPPPPLTLVHTGLGVELNVASSTAPAQRGHPASFTLSGARAASVGIIERRILQHPNDIRPAARSYAQAVKACADELRCAKPNDPARLPQYNDLLGFLERMATGITELADALDHAFENATPQPVFLGNAAQIVTKLQLETAAWLEKIGTDVIDVPVRVGVLMGCGLFLHSFGLDSEALFAGIGAVVGFPSKPPKG